MARAVKTSIRQRIDLALHPFLCYPTTSMTYLQPLDHHILIRPLAEDKTTASGIVIPGSAENEWTSRGTVIAVGDGRLDKAGRNPMDAKVGDVVLYPKGEGQKALDDDIILPETHVLGTLDGEAFFPYWDKVLVELDLDDNETAGGVILPGSTIEKGYDFGRVISVGPGYPTMGHRQPVEVEVGDRVVFSQFNSMELDLGASESRRFYITRVSQDGIKAVITGSA